MQDNMNQWAILLIVTSTQIRHHSARDKEHDVCKSYNINGYDVDFARSCENGYGVKLFGTRKCCVRCDRECPLPGYARVIADDEPGNGCFGECMKCALMQEPTQHYKDTTNNRCSQCKPCELLGMVTAKNCTETENAECVPRESQALRRQSTIITTVAVSHLTNTEALYMSYTSDNGEQPHTTTTITLICGVLISIIVIIVILILLRHKCMYAGHDTRNQEIYDDDGILTSNTKLLEERNGENQYEEIDETNRHKHENEQDLASDQVPGCPNSDQRSGFMTENNNYTENTTSNSSNGSDEQEVNISSNIPSTQVCCGVVQSLDQRNYTNGNINEEQAYAKLHPDCQYANEENSQLRHNVQVQDNCSSEQLQNVHVQTTLKVSDNSCSYENVEDRCSSINAVELQQLSHTGKRQDIQKQNNKERPRHGSHDGSNKRKVPVLQRSRSVPTKVIRVNLPSYKEIKMRLSKGIFWFRWSKPQHRSTIIMDNSYM